MNRKKMQKPLCVIALLAGTIVTAHAWAQAPLTIAGYGGTTTDAVLLTIHLQHDQSRPLGKLREQLDHQGFYKAFPPEGVEVVSWTVAMGIGQVVVLRLPASRLADVNLALENTAWGAYRTAFFPTYDLKDAAHARVAEARAAK